MSASRRCSRARAALLQVRERIDVAHDAGVVDVEVDPHVGMLLGDLVQVGTWIGRIFAGSNYVAGWIMSVVGAMILLLLYRLLFKRGA